VLLVVLLPCGGLQGRTAIMLLGCADGCVWRGRRVCRGCPSSHVRVGLWLLGVLQSPNINNALCAALRHPHPRKRQRAKQNVASSKIVWEE
jgi:hypothetical protein